MYSTPTSRRRSPQRLVYQRFRVRRIDLAIAHQRAVGVVNAHSAVVWTTDAAKKRSVAGCDGSVDVDELPRGVANALAAFLDVVDKHRRYLKASTNPSGVDLIRSGSLTWRPVEGRKW